MTDLDWLDDPPPARNWRRDRPRTTDPTRHSTRRTTMTTTVRGLEMTKDEASRVIDTLENPEPPEPGWVA